MHSLYLSGVRHPLRLDQIRVLNLRELATNYIEIEIRDKN